jgi:AcrR family transcriptional regulator
MGIAERRERDRDELRRRILDSARDLFAREGYDRVTMRAIAEAIEYSPTAIYQHFKDKDALVEALCHEDFSRLLGAFTSRPLPPDPIERIRQVGKAYVRFGLDHPNHYRFMFMTGMKGKDHELSAPGQQSFLVLREAVAQGIAAGRLRDIGVDTAAQVLWSVVHGVVSLLVTYRPDQFPHGPAAPDLVEQALENGLRGLVLDVPAKPRRKR